MPAPQIIFPGKSVGSGRFSRHAPLLVFIFIISYLGASVNLSQATEPTAHAPYFVPILAAGNDAATVAVSPDALPRSTSPADTLEPHAGKILKEVGKQTIDQPGHFLIGAAPIWASRYLVGVPWYGWVVTPLLAYREWLQWPSNRWWDPPLDWACLSLGVIVATWRRRPMQRLLNGLPLRRHIVRGLSWGSAWPGDTAPDLGHAYATLSSGAARSRGWLSAAEEAGCRR
jgi:hypothetical protein